MPVTELHIHAPHPTSTNFFAEHLTWKQHDLLVTLAPIEEDDPVQWFTTRELSVLLRELVEMMREENDVRYIGCDAQATKSTLSTLVMRGLVEHNHGLWRLSPKGIEWANANV